MYVIILLYRLASAVEVQYFKICLACKGGLYILERVRFSAFISEDQRTLASGTWKIQIEVLHSSMIWVSSFFYCGKYSLGEEFYVYL